MDEKMQAQAVIYRKEGKSEAAKNEVYASGYKFEKGCSLNTTKRQNLNKDIRESQIHDIKEQIEDINYRIFLRLRDSVPPTHGQSSHE